MTTTIPPVRAVAWTEEDQKTNTALTVAEGAVTAISDLPTIHAVRLDVIAKAVTNSLSVTLRKYGASQRAYVDEVLGVVAAGSTSSFVVTATFIGQTLDVIVENTDGAGSGDPTVYDLWIGARG